MKATFLGLIPLLLASPLHAQWRPTNVPGKVYMLRLAAFGDTLFTSGFELYQSTDRGETWSDVGGRMGGGNKISVLRKGDALFVSAYENDLYRSIDRGVTWAPASSGLPSRMVSHLKADGGDLYVSIDWRGLYLSRDEGATWAAANGNLPTRPDEVLTSRYEIRDYIVSGGRIFAGTDRDGLFRSADRGQTWVHMDGLPAGMVRALCQAGSAVFATIGSEVFRSPDEGRTWLRMGSGVLEQEVSSLVFSAGSLYAGSNKGNFVSSDLGETWRALGGFPSTAQPTITDITWLGDICLAATDLGVFRSLNGGATWTQRIAGTRSAGISALLSAGTTLYASPMNDPALIRTEDLGHSWEKAGQTPPLKVRSLLLADGMPYAGTDNGILRSGDAGGTWEETGLKGRPVNQLVAAGNGILARTQDSLYRTTNRGENWINVSNNFPNPDSMPLYPFGMAAMNEEVLAISGFRRIILRSPDMGDSWAPLPGSDALNAWGIAFGSGDILTYGGKGIHRSTDDGRTWIRLNLPAPSGQVLSLLAIGTHLFAGTDKGLAHSPNLGATWAWAEAGWAPDIRVLVQQGSYLLAGSAVYGLWRRPLSEFMVPTSASPFLERGKSRHGTRGELMLPGMVSGTGKDHGQCLNPAFDLHGRRLLIESAIFPSPRLRIP